MFFIVPLQPPLNTPMRTVENCSSQSVSRRYKYWWANVVIWCWPTFIQVTWVNSRHGFDVMIAL